MSRPTAFAVAHPWPPLPTNLSKKEVFRFPKSDSELMEELKEAQELIEKEKRALAKIKNSTSAGKEKTVIVPEIELAIYWDRHAYGYKNYVDEKALLDEFYKSINLNEKNGNQKLSEINSVVKNGKSYQNRNSHQNINENRTIPNNHNSTLNGDDENDNEANKLDSPTKCNNGDHNPNKNGNNRCEINDNRNKNGDIQKKAVPQKTHSCKPKCCGYWDRSNEPNAVKLVRKIPESSKTDTGKYFAIEGKAITQSHDNTQITDQGVVGSKIGSAVCCNNCNCDCGSRSCSRKCSPKIQNVDVRKNGGNDAPIKTLRWRDSACQTKPISCECHCFCRQPRLKQLRSQSAAPKLVRNVPSNNGILNSSKVRRPMTSKKKVRSEYNVSFRNPYKIADSENRILKQKILNKCFRESVMF